MAEEEFKEGDRVEVNPEDAELFTDEDGNIYTAFRVNYLSHLPPERDPLFKRLEEELEETEEDGDDG